MKTLIHYAAGIIFSLCLMVTLLITSVEAVVYWTPGYFEKEYAKYNVTEAVDMTMEDLLDVTDQMMAYLRGKRADLHVDTTMGGVSREFFNEREIAHMEDVRGLFLDALAIRRGCLLLMALCIIILFLLKADFKRVFPKSVCSSASPQSSQPLFPRISRNISSCSITSFSATIYGFWTLPQIC